VAPSPHRADWGSGHPDPVKPMMAGRGTSRRKMASVVRGFTPGNQSLRRIAVQNLGAVAPRRSSLLLRPSLLNGGATLGIAAALRLTSAALGTARHRAAAIFATRRTHAAAEHPARADGASCTAIVIVAAAVCSLAIHSHRFAASNWWRGGTLLRNRSGQFLEGREPWKQEPKADDRTKENLR
jgi:hypothetical protein